MKKTSRDVCRFSARAVRFRRVIRIVVGIVAFASLVAGGVVAFASKSPAPSSPQALGLTQDLLFSHRI